MVFDLGSIRASLDIDDTSYSKGLLNATAVTNAFGQSFTDAITNPVVFGIGKLREFAGAAVSMGQQVIATAEEVQRLGESTGFTTDLIQALRAEFERAGKGADQADDILKEFNLRLGEARQGSGEAAEAFRVLGSDILGISDVRTALDVVLERLNQVEDGSQRAALANQLFSEGGVRALDVLDEKLEVIEQRQRDLGQVTRSDSIASLADLNITLGEFQQLVDGLLTQGLSEFLAGFADQTGIAGANLQEVSERLQDEIVPAGRQLGEIAAGLIGDLSGNPSPLLDRLVELVQGLNVLLGNNFDFSTRGLIAEIAAGLGVGKGSTFLPGNNGPLGGLSLEEANRRAQQRERSLNR